MPQKPWALFYLLIGHLSLVLGIVGIFLPVLPTTPFLLLTCSCYARSSARFHRAMISSRWAGPTLRNWEKNKSISLRTKITAVMMLTAATLLTIVSVPLLAVKITLVITAIGVSWYIVSRPSPNGTRILAAKPQA